MNEPPLITEAEIEAMRDALRAAYDPVLAEPVPAALRNAAQRGLKRQGPGRLAAALLASGVAIGVWAGWQLQGAGPDVETQVARRAAAAHVAFAAEVRHPVEMGADQEAQLAAWLSERLGMKVWAPNLRDAGMALVGGRLLPGETKPAAWLMYEALDGRRVTLYWSPDTTRKGKGELGYTREKNVDIFHWVDEECGYAVVSADTGKEALRRIASLVY